ncbi:MAG: hypothetical protein QOJ85_3477 [Solirubrobacteraceae bacterium]|nr:hypothetical protein [Solirubrobacteraceae bacterium]
MSTTAAETPTSNRPAVTWRDAVTPLSRASRRRWTACFALLLALLGAGFVSDTFAVERTGEQGTPIVLFVALPIVFGMLRRGTRRIAALDHPDLDERDITARNTAYRVAFPLLVLLMLATFVALAFALPGAVRHVRHPGVDVTELRDGWFLEPQALIGLALWLGLWAVYLPTGVLAWREPDALEPETASGALPERLRDALLGLALAGAAVVSLVSEDDAGTLLFVAALALLGALARRAAGQPMMSRQRQWRIAIGIVLIFIVAGLAFVLGASR